MFRQQILLLVAAAVLSAQAPQDSTQLEVDQIARTQNEQQARMLLQDLFGGRAAIRAIQAKLRNGESEVASLALVRAERKDSFAALRAGSARMFRETGSINPGLGSTSAVAKTSATELIGLALESGAVTGTTDKTTATFQLNALPAWQFLNGSKGPHGCGGIQTRLKAMATGICESGVGFWLRGLTASVSLNVNSKETATPVLATNTANQSVVTGIRVLTNPSKLSAVGAKYELFQRERDPKQQALKLKDIATKLNEDLTASGMDLKLQEAIDSLINEPFYESWLAESVNGAIPFRTNASQLREYVDGRLEELAEWALDIPAAKMLLAIQKPYDDFVNRIAELEAQYLFKKSLAFDFVHSRPTDQPFMNTIRLDFNSPLGKHREGDKEGPPASIDINVSIAMYHEAQLISAKSVRLRNASVSLAINYRLRSWGGLGSPVLTLAGYYQYMFQNGLIDFKSSAFTPGASNIPLSGPALEVLNTKGSIGLGQLRLEIPLGKDSGITFPVAVSYANRTELIKDPNRKFWQGHVGLSYDLSKLQEAFLKRRQQ